jgi:hypothetical protein
MQVGAILRTTTYISMSLSRIARVVARNVRLANPTRFQSSHTAATMNLLESGVNISGDDFKVNSAEMAAAVSQLRSRLHVVEKGGGEKAMQKHTERGKLHARDRINGLCDPGTPFLEMSPLAGWEDDHEKRVAAGGILTGIGRVSGYVVSGFRETPLESMYHLSCADVKL